MIPRGKLDLSWPDILTVAASALRPQATQRIEEALYHHWGHSNATACLSVRSGFDALLTALNLPEGSEIIFSAYTVGDMVDIARAHGLTPVPLDLNIDTLGPSIAALEKLVSDKTQLIVFAHLFGARADIDALATYARSRNIMLIEDCAQAFTGDDYRGHPGADVSMFSFGPIKTATALGGALMNFRHAELRERFTRIIQNYKQQSRTAYLLRAVKYSAIKILSYRSVYTLFIMLCNLFNKDYSQVISGSLRNFAPHELLTQMRHRPCRDLLNLMRRKIKKTTSSHCRRRTALGVEAEHMLYKFKRPGSSAPFHSYWGFPILCANRDQHIARLREHGFDANTGSASMKVIPDCREGELSTPSNIEQMYQNMILLPVYNGMTMRELQNMLAILQQPTPAASDDANYEAMAK